MKLLLTILLFATSLQAADWTGAVWSTIYTRTEGHFDGYMRGINCTGDTVYLTNENDSDLDICDLFRVAPGGVAERITIPFTDGWPMLNYSSVSQDRPALLNPTDATLWTLQGNAWDSLALREEPGDSNRHPWSFGFDSAGAIHTVWSTPSNWGSFLYRRRGGDQPNRDDSLAPPLSPDVFLLLSTTMFAFPSAHSVVLDIRANPDPELLQTGIWLFTSLGNSPFATNGIGIGCLTGSVVLCQNPNGSWAHGYGSGRLAEVAVCPDIACSESGIDRIAGFQIGAFHITSNPTDSVFETAAFTPNAIPNAVALLHYVSEQGMWSDDGRVSLPMNAIGGLKFTIDHLGRGHLFVVDSTHLYHYGPPLLVDAAPLAAIVPDGFALTAYPNPFNSTTRISFNLPVTESVELGIYDILGRRVAELFHEPLSAGFHERNFEANGMASGLYFIRLQTASQTRYGKLVLMR